MTRRFPLPLALVATFVCASPAAVTGAGITGQLHGTLSLKAAPPVPWRIELADEAGIASLPLTLSATADGLDLRVALHQRAGDDLLWSIETATVDLVEWWPAIRALAGLDESFEGWRIGGRVSLTGSGKIIDGQPWGRVQITIEDAHAVNDTDGIEVRQIQANLHCDDLIAFSLRPGQTIRAGLIQSAGITATDAVIRLGRTAAGVIDLQQLSAHVFDGTVALEPFSFDPRTPMLRARLRFDGLSVPAMTALVPTAISSARGRLGGAGSVLWHLDKPVPDEVLLTFENPGAANVSLSPQPGLLSAGVPPRFTLLPINLGPLTKLFAPENPAYKPLVAIELGRLPLRIDELKIVFTPKTADALGRSASLHLKGSPENNALIKSVTIDLNVHGAISEVISLGTDRRLR
ncbi:MAG: YdbH domain-containing protein [Verrucomicrobiota bacterium]